MGVRNGIGEAMLYIPSKVRQIAVVCCVFDSLAPHIGKLRRANFIQNKHVFMPSYLVMFMPLSNLHNSFNRVLKQRKHCMQINRPVQSKSFPPQISKHAQ